jgi:hypothetical protein
MCGLALPNQVSVYQPDLLVICEPAAVTRRGVEGCRCWCAKS